MASWDPLRGGRRPSTEPTGSELRASDADRDRIAEVLRDAAAEGRLSIEELEERLNRAWNAKTYSELDGLTDDLPDTAPVTAGSEDNRPARTVSDRVQTILGSEKLTGRWVVPERLSVTVVAGEVTLDMTEAVLPNEVVVDGTIGLSQLTIIVPDGVAVDLSGASAVLAERKNRVDVPHVPGTPVVRVTGNLLMAEVIARTPKKRRWFQRGRS